MLRYGQRNVRLPRVQPLRPALAGGGGSDVEEGAAVGHGIPVRQTSPLRRCAAPPPQRGEVERGESPPLVGRRPRSGQRGEVETRRAEAGGQWRRLLRKNRARAVWAGVMSASQAWTSGSAARHTCMTLVGKLTLEGISFRLKS
jgi:hypothetical protein